MNRLSRKVYALGAVALAVVLFVSLNIVANTWLGTAQLDLTQNSLFTVSPGTKATLDKLPEPVTLRFYFSREPATSYATIVAYAQRVRDLLQEYAALGLVFGCGASAFPTVQNGLASAVTYTPFPFAPTVCRRFLHEGCCFGFSTAFV